MSPIATADFATTSAADLATVKRERESAESAETDAFNPVIAAASGDAKMALQNGKIKNKVLKREIFLGFLHFPCSFDDEGGRMWRG